PAEVRESVATGVQHGSGGGFVAAREGDLPEHALGHGLLRQRVLSSRVLERPLRGGRGALEVAAEEVGVSEMPVDGGQIPRLAERQHAAAGVYEVAPTADEIARAHARVAKSHKGKGGLRLGSDRGEAVQRPLQRRNGRREVATVEVHLSDVVLAHRRGPWVADALFERK